MANELLEEEAPDDDGDADGDSHVPVVSGAMSTTALKSSPNNIYMYCEQERSVTTGAGLLFKKKKFNWGAG